MLLPVLDDDFEAQRDVAVEGDQLLYGGHRYPIAPDTRREDDTPSSVYLRQHYRLISERLADSELNYRRFFAISDLAGLRVEDPEVYATTHREILRWITEYGVRGLRIDHPDGLAAPGQYLERLKASAPEAWIVVEKITQPDEELPSQWPVAGMTGYDALGQVNALLIDPKAELSLDEIYVEVTGDYARGPSTYTMGNTRPRPNSWRRSFDGWLALPSTSRVRKKP